MTTRRGLGRLATTNPAASNVDTVPTCSSSLITLVLAIG